MLVPPGLDIATMWPQNKDLRAFQLYSVNSVLYPVSHSPDNDSLQMLNTMVTQHLEK
jgi:hypothetical protein